MLPIALCYLASGFLDYFSGRSYYTFVFYAFCAFVPFVLAVVFAFVVDRKHITQTVLLPVAFLVLTGVPILSMHTYLPVAQFISIGELGLETVIFVAAVAFSDFFNLNSLKVCALARTCATLFNSIGWYIAAFVEQSYSGIASAQLSLLVVFFGIEVLVVCLIVSIVKAQKSIVEDIGEGKLDCVASVDSISTSSDAFPKAEDSHVFVGSGSGDAGISAGEGGDSSSEGNAAPWGYELLFERCCREVAKEYELTNREVDVLELLARGYSAARVQKELYIAAGTVNYHTRNIYAKLGAHSKQEVIDFIAGRMG